LSAPSPAGGLDPARFVGGRPPIAHRGERHPPFDGAPRDVPRHVGHVLGTERRVQFLAQQAPPLVLDLELLCPLGGGTPTVALRTRLGELVPQAIDDLPLRLHPVRQPAEQQRLVVARHPVGRLAAGTRIPQRADLDGLFLVLAQLTN